jgi:hypothetical protein
MEVFPNFAFIQASLSWEGDNAKFGLAYDAFRGQR